MKTNTTSVFSKRLILLLLILSTTVFLTTTTSAFEDNHLFLVYYDCETQEQLLENTKIFYEGKNYDIEVGSIGEIGYIYDVTVTVPWKTLITTRETPWITITTPPYEDYPEGFILTATKDGYTPIEEHIQIFKGRLIVTIDRGIVDEGDYFTATVTDQNNQLLPDVDIYLESYGYEIGHATSNTNGLAFIEAPDVQETTDIIIRAFRAGYQPGSTTIHIENTPQLIFSQHLPILCALFILLASMLIVRLRKRQTRKTPPPRSNRISKPPAHRQITRSSQPIQKPQNVIDPNAVSAVQQPIRQKSPRVEEIRIHASEKKRVTNYISPNSEPETKSGNDPKKWLEGTNNVKYKINELTGEIDPKNKDKWFEGVENIKDTVDKKLKKNYKQKDT